MPTIELKSSREIALLKQAGQTAARILRKVCEAVQPGVTTRELNAKAESWMREQNVIPAFLNYRGYPAVLCTSVNDEVVHSIPGDRVLKHGDLISIDIGIYQNGYCGDTATTIAVGDVSPAARRLMNVGWESLQNSLAAARLGNRLGDVSYAMGEVVEKNGFYVVHEYGGHGIGRRMHEDPHVACSGRSGMGIRLQEGLVLALEVMANEKSSAIDHKDDGWTVVTAEHGLSVHYEDMVAVTANGPEILTELPEGMYGKGR